MIFISPPDLLSCCVCYTSEAFYILAVTYVNASSLTSPVFFLTCLLCASSKISPQRVNLILILDSVSAFCLQEETCGITRTAV